MARYVLCFLFNRSRTAVVLLEKLRPAWQRGKCNCPGGEIEGGESVPEASSREFEEETGIQVPDAAWREFAVLMCPDAEIHCVEARHPDECPPVKATTDEVPMVATLASLHALKRVQALDVLVHLALAGMEPVTLCRLT